MAPLDRTADEKRHGQRADSHRTVTEFTENALPRNLAARCRDSLRTER